MFHRQMIWKARKKLPFCATTVCWELTGHFHTFPSVYLALFLTPVPESTPGPSAADTRVLLTSLAVHGHAGGADRVAPADTAFQPAVGDTLVLLADALWNRSAAVSP